MTQGRYKVHKVCTNCIHKCKQMAELNGYPIQVICPIKQTGGNGNEDEEAVGQAISKRGRVRGATRDDPSRRHPESNTRNDARRIKASVVGSQRQRKIRGGSEVKHGRRKATTRK